MKYLILLITYAVTLNVFAETNEQAIQHACLQQADSLVKQIQSEIYPDMQKTDADKIRYLSTENCKESLLGQSEITVKETENGKTDPESEDWFTKIILSGEKADKEGNKRLERMRRR